jgi:hypothetical protein
MMTDSRLKIVFAIFRLPLRLLFASLELMPGVAGIVGEWWNIHNGFRPIGPLPGNSPRKIQNVPLPGFSNP